MSDSLPQIDGTYNSRDLGGPAASGGSIRRGVLIRSDAPVRVTEEGARSLQRLEIRRAIDLREGIERTLDPVRLAHLGIEVVHRPVIGRDFLAGRNMGLEAIYMKVLEARGTRLAGAVAALAEPAALPALVFCSAGKDRTGLVSALVLGALGVDDEQIVADYRRTEDNMHGAFRSAIVSRAVRAGISEQELAVKVGAPAELMRRVLRHMRSEWGGARGYLLAHGLSEGELAVIREQLVEPLASVA